MNILALIPPKESKGNVVRDVLYGCWCKGRRIGGGTVPPLTLLSVASVLRGQGHQVQLLDAGGEGKTLNDVKKEIHLFGLAIVLTSSMSFKEDARALAALKSENPRLITSVFGSHPTFMPEVCLQNGAIDIMVRYEPEFIYRDLANGLQRQDGSWKEVKGIAFKEDGAVKINDPYPFIDNLDELPMPDRSLLNKKIVYFNPLIKRMPYTTSVTSRGCPGRCTFCTAPAFTGTKVRYNSADYVIKEIEYLLSLGFKEIYYRDETFSFFNQRNKAVCEAIKEKKLKVSWLCNIRVGTVKKEMLALMKEAGCHTIKVGVESGVQEILNTSNKGIRLQDTQSLFQWARELGVSTHAHVMLGMPGENRETIKRTIDFVVSLEPTTVDFGICTPYPGAPLFDNLVQQHRELKDTIETDWESLHVTGSFNKYFTELTPQELEDSVYRAYRRFYARPSYIASWIKRIACDARELLRVVRAGFNVLLFCFVGEKE